MHMIKLLNVDTFFYHLDGNEALGKSANIQLLKLGLYWNLIDDYYCPLESKH